jgi:hypothetical protein
MREGLKMDITLLTQWRYVAFFIRKRDLTKCDVAVLFILTDYYHRTWGRAWPSFDTIAKEIGFSRRAVIDSRNKLEKLGYLKLVDGPGRSNNYRPCFELIEHLMPENRVSEADFTNTVKPTAPLEPLKVKRTAPNTSYIPVAYSVGDVRSIPTLFERLRPGGYGSVAWGRVMAESGV